LDSRVNPEFPAPASAAATRAVVRVSGTM